MRIIRKAILETERTYAHADYFYSHSFVSA